MRKSDAAYRNLLIRRAAGLTGDMAVVAAMVQACVWLIEAAALGLFLQFLLWLLAALLALAISQYLIHPAVNALFAEDKLTRTSRALAELRRGFDRHVTPAVKDVPWGDVLAGVSRFRPKPV